MSVEFEWTDRDKFDKTALEIAETLGLGDPDICNDSSLEEIVPK